MTTMTGISYFIVMIMLLASGIVSVAEFYVNKNPLFGIAGGVFFLALSQWVEGSKTKD